MCFRAGTCLRCGYTAEANRRALLVTDAAVTWRAGRGTQAEIGSGLRWTQLLPLLCVCRAAADRHGPAAGFLSRAALRASRRS
jgi:hypothetical protein